MLLCENQSLDATQKRVGCYMVCLLEAFNGDIRGMVEIILDNPRSMCLLLQGSLNVLVKLSAR